MARILSLVLLLMLLTAGSAAAAVPDAPWSGTGTGSTTVVADGSAAQAPTFTYDAGGYDGAWTFTATAAAARVQPVDWQYTGFHSYYRVEVKLQRFVRRAGVEVVTDTLKQAGPANAGNTPSGGFSYSGSTTFDLQPGDVYGFRMTGSNFDGLRVLRGTLKLTDDPTPPAVEPVITGTLGADGYYASDVTVAWAVTDAESEVTSDCPETTIDADTEGRTVTCEATSAAGSTSQSVTIKRHAPAPAAAPAVAPAPAASEPPVISAAPATPEPHSLRLSVAQLSVFGRAAGECRAAGGPVGSCALTLRAGGRVLARGKRTAQPGADRVRVPLALTARGRRLLAGRLGGLRATVTATDATSTATARTRAILAVERITTPPGAWAPDEAVLTPAGHRFLRSLRGRLFAVARLRCDGHSAALEAGAPSSKPALALSLRRAQRVCGALRRLGAGGKPIVAAHGAADPIRDDTSRAGRARNRRVDITLRH